MKEIDFYNLSFNQLIDNDYFIVSVRKDEIVASYFRLIDKNEFEICQVNFISLSSDVLFNLIIKHNSLLKSISLSHSLYIGKEIYKAELSKILSQKYVQS